MEVEASVGRSCVECLLEPPLPLFIMIGALGSFLLLGTCYAITLIKRPQYLKHFSSTIAIVVAHLQTLTIIANLRLAWPPSTRQVISFLVVNGLQLEAT